MSSHPDEERYSNVPATTMAIEIAECCSSNGGSSGPEVQTTSDTVHPSPFGEHSRLSATPEIIRPQFLPRIQRPRLALQRKCSRRKKKEIFRRMTAKPKQERAVVDAPDRAMGGNRPQARELAAEFPEKNSNTSRRKMLRTFGDVLRHVAFWNRYVADSLRGKKANDTDNELPIEEYRTKSRMIKALEQSSTNRRGAEGSRPGSEDPPSWSMAFIEHTCEHYGQLVVYSRLAGIVPPALAHGV